MKLISHRVISVLLLSGVMIVPVLFAEGCKGQTSEPVDSKAQASYYCPMHPDVVAAQPVNCSVCGMKLILKETEK